MTTERRGSQAGGADTSSANGATPQLPETADSLFFGGVADAFRGITIDEEDEPDEADSEELSGDDEPDELDGEAGDDSDEGDEPDESDAEADTAAARAPKAKGTRTPREWVELMLTDGVQRISEAPAAVRADPNTWRAYGDAMVQKGRLEAYAATTEQLRGVQNARKLVKTVDDRFADDPDGKLDWIERDPQAALYINARRYLQQLDQQTPEDQVAQSAQTLALHERAQRQHARLAKWPELQRELERRQREERKYPVSDEGITLLERDVDELMAEGYARGAGAGDGEATGNGARPARPRAARPAIGTGNGRSTTAGPRTRAPDISKINDPAELFGLGVEQALRTTRPARR